MVDAPIVAEKSTFVAPPGTAQRFVVPKNRARQVVSPEVAAAPLCPLFFPSFHDRKTRRTSKTESALGVGLASTLTVRLAELMTALVGMLLPGSNLMSARLRNASPLEPAVVPATRVESAPKLLFGSVSKRVVSATG